MKAVVQRVSKVAVSVDRQEIGKIGYGLLVLLGIHETDMQKDMDYLVKRIAQMRIFEDGQGKMNISAEDVRGRILNISQFTLFVDTKKGNRPSFVEATRPETAIPLYESFNGGIGSCGVTIATEQFKADISVSLVNDGPVTTIIDSENK